MISTSRFHALMTSTAPRSAVTDLDRQLRAAAKYRAREAAILGDILDERERAMAAAGLDECAAFLSPPRVP